MIDEFGTLSTKRVHAIILSENTNKRAAITKAAFFTPVYCKTEYNIPVIIIR